MDSSVTHLSDAIGVRYNVGDCRLNTIATHTDNTGQLWALERSADIPFEPQRVFYIRAADPTTERGRHAHIRCTQLLICLTGRMDILMKDEQGEARFILDNPGQSLLVPPGIWCEQCHFSADTILMVVCDRPYEVEDYIHDFASYLAHRKQL